MSERNRLPDRRLTETFGIVHADKPYTVSVGFFDQWTVWEKDRGCVDEHRRVPAEVFISGTKAGSDVEAVARDGAVLLSIALQFGVPLVILAGAVTRGGNDEPLSIIGTVIDRLVQEQK